MTPDDLATKLTVVSLNVRSLASTLYVQAVKANKNGKLKGSGSSASGGSSSSSSSSGSGSGSGSGNSEDNMPEDHIAAAALYIAAHAPNIRTNAIRTSTNTAGSSSKGGKDDERPGFSVSQLLREADMTLMEFFASVKSLVHVLSLDGAFDAHLKMLERSFVVASILFHKYEKVWASILVAADKYPLLYSLGWHLFLLTQAELLDTPPDLQYSFYLLLSVIAQAAVLIPAKDLKGPLDGGPGAPRDALSSLAKDAGVETGPLLAVFDSHMGPLLVRTLARWLGDPKPDSAAAGDITGDMVHSHIHELLASATSEYNIVHLTRGGLDERAFLHPDGAAILWTGGAKPGSGPASAAERAKGRGATGAPSMAARKFYNLHNTPPLSTRRANQVRAAAAASPSLLHTALRYPSSPMGSAGRRSRPGTPGSKGPVPPTTPMTGANVLMRWMDSMFGRGVPEDGTLPPPLQRYVDAASSDAVSAETIAERATRVVASLPLEAGIPSRVPRSSLALGLYYRALAALLDAESSRVGVSDFSTLLGSDHFHTALLSVTLEVTVFAFKAARAEFPAVLMAASVDAFHFAKVLDSFLSVAVSALSIPQGIVVHLREVEESILERYAWVSPLVRGLLDPESRYNDGVVAQIEQQRAALLSALRTGVAPPASALYAESPRKPRSARGGGIRRPTRTALFQSDDDPPADDGAVADMAIQGEPDPESGPEPEPEPEQEPRAKSGTLISLELFVRKVCALLFRRLTDLCSRLAAARHVLVQTWETLTHVLIHHRDLMWHRHLDVILIATLYGVARANGLSDFTFKAILEQYKTQPQASSRIYKHVLLQGGAGESGDIIAFYNKVYIPLLKERLLALQSDAQANGGAGLAPEGMVPGSPARGPDAFRVGSRNLFLSPIRPRSPGSALRPASRHGAAPSSSSARYDFGQSPAKTLHEINLVLRNKRPRSPSSSGLAPAAAGRPDSPPPPDSPTAAASSSRARRAKRRKRL